MPFYGHLTLWGEQWVKNIFQKVNNWNPLHSSNVTPRSSFWHCLIFNNSSVWGHQDTYLKWQHDIPLLKGNHQDLISPISKFCFYPSLSLLKPLLIHNGLPKHFSPIFHSLPLLLLPSLFFPSPPAPIPDIRANNQCRFILVKNKWNSSWDRDGRS